MMLRSKIAAALMVAAFLVSGVSYARPVSQAASLEPAHKGDGKLFALILRPGAAWKPGRPFAEQGLRPHFDYWMGLFREGRIVTAGPLGDDSGLVLLFANDFAGAEAIMHADPAIIAQIFTGDVRPYAPPMINAVALSKKD